MRRREDIASDPITSMATRSQERDGTPNVPASPPETRDQSGTHTRSEPLPQLLLQGPATWVPSHMKTGNHPSKGAP